MTELFRRGELRDYLSNRILSRLETLDRMAEDEILSRSTDDLVDQVVETARLAPLVIGADPIDGGVTETQVETDDDFDRGRYKVPGLRIHAVYDFSGDQDLFYYTPSVRLGTRFNATVAPGTVTVQVEQSGSTPDGAVTRQALDREIGLIRTMVAHSAADVSAFNTRLEDEFRPFIERRKRFLQDRRDLAGALGFPLNRRADAPVPVPMQRKAIGVQRSAASTVRPPYRDEPALNEAQYDLTSTPWG